MGLTLLPYRYTTIVCCRPIQVTIFLPHVNLVHQFVVILHWNSTEIFWHQKTRISAASVTL